MVNDQETAPSCYYYSSPNKQMTGWYIPEETIANEEIQSASPNVAGSYSRSDENMDRSRETEPAVGAGDRLLGGQTLNGR